MMRILFLALILFPLAALAHGDAWWIQQNPEYLAASGTHCCGEHDCAVAAPGGLERIDRGWRHVPTGTVLLDDQVGNHPSRDARLWRCVSAGRLRCVFSGLSS